TIRYQLREAGAVELVVYNTLGQQVALLVNEYQAAGAHQAVWDARDQNGRSLPSGIYLYRLRSGEFVKSHKMLLAR
ncbi:MAG: T9SS type A sorting domain-containing protein, partial [Calditrichaeota bacterium]|nr:T9SS type A sorting domain-containing protein [Calditrichota bacterium]